MTAEYSRVSETARAVELFVLPGILSYLDSMRAAIAAMDPATPFVIAEYGAADGANSSHLFERIVRHVRAMNPALRVRLVYVDIADPAPFEAFWAESGLARLEGVEAAYLRRSFYGPIPELAGSVHLGFSSTALHWLDAASVGADFFRHPTGIQPNQLSEDGRRRFAEKWQQDWRVFFRERAREVGGGGLLFLAALTCLGGDRWPASAAYDNLRDVCFSLYREGRISRDELEAIFVPDYFATPEEIRDLLEEEAVGREFALALFDAMTVPCAYFSRMHETLEDEQGRRGLAETLSGAVRAWSESSIRVGLSPGHADLVDEIYRRLADRFFEVPRGLPYQYCLVALARASGDPLA
jgi:SAM-dependent methyltransferase